jgi:flagellar motor switch protein FliN/FliY
MSNKLLLQEEIDALLGKLNQPQEPKPSEEERTIRILEISKKVIAQLEKSFLEMLNLEVSVTDITPGFVNGKNQWEDLEFPLVASKGNFTGGLAGHNLLMAKIKDASTIVENIIGGSTAPKEGELTEEEANIMNMVYSQFAVTFSGVLSEHLKKEVQLSQEPLLILQETGDLLSVKPYLSLIYHLKLGETKNVCLIQVLSLEFSEVLAPTGLTSAPPQGFSQDASSTETFDYGQIDYKEPEISVDKTKLNLILEIPLKVSVVLGKAKLPIKKVLELTTGSLVELSSKSNEPVDVLVNGTLVAKGEVIVVNESFGVRINSIISPAERIKYLEG